MASDAGMRQAPASLIKSIWKTGLWRYFPCLLIYSLGLAIILPIIPTIITDGFASQAIGYEVHCGDFVPDEAPRECHDAHAKAVVWASWASFVSGAFLSFTCAPIIGSLSDRYGRKPFLMLGMSLTSLPLLMATLHLWGLLPIQAYFPANALSGLCSSFTMMLTAVADLMHQSHRAVALGFFIAMFNVGIICGPIVGTLLSPLQALYACGVLIATALLYVVFVVPESAPGAISGRSKAKGKAPWSDAGAGESGASCHCASDRDIAGCNESTPLLHSAASLSTGSCSGDLQDEGFLMDIERGLLHKVTGMDGVRKADQQIPEGRSRPSEEEFRMAGPGTGARAVHGELRTVGPDKAGPGPGAQATSGQLPGHVPTSGEDSMLRGWLIFYHDPWYQKLALIWTILSVNQTAFQELLFQYLQLTLGFTTADQAELLVILSVASLIVKFVFLAILVQKLGEQRLLVFGLAVLGLEQILLGLAATKAMVFLAVSVGGFSNVAWPALLALQSSRVGPQLQGAVSGVMQGLGSLASGIGPLAFAYLFSASTSLNPGKLVPYCPQLVWYLAALVVSAAVLITCTLHWDSSEVLDEALMAKWAAKEQGGQKDTEKVEVET